METKALKTFLVENNGIIDYVMDYAMAVVASTEEDAIRMAKEKSRDFAELTDDKIKVREVTSEGVVLVANSGA